MFEGIKFINGGKFRSLGDWLHETRTIDTAELIIVTDGEVNMFIGDAKYTARSGDILRIMPGERHGGTVPSSRVSFFWLHFKPSGDSYDLPVYFSPESSERVQLISRELLHYHESEGYPDECADSMLRVLLFELSHESRDAGKLASEIKEYVRRYASAGLKTTDIAKHFGYNEDYLNRVFRRTLGVGLKKYISDTLITRIKRDLLVGGIPLCDIAARYGFAEYKYFLKFFKYHEGISPTSYRETYYNLHTN